MSEIEAQPVPMLGGSWAGFSRPAHSADEQARAAINAAARLIPDEMFATDPEVRRLRATHGARLARQHAPEGKRLPGVTFGGVMATDREP